MDNQKVEYIKFFLNKCKINISNLHDLNNMILPREILLNTEIYNNIKDEISKLKKMFNSSYMTSLQSTASTTQKWPLLNLIRQLLKTIFYKMTPKRISNGYSKEGKKLFKRVFIIEKINQTSDSGVSNSVFDSFEPSDLSELPSLELSSDVLEDSA